MTTDKTAPQCSSAQRFKFNPNGRWSKSEKRLRLFNIVWRHGKGPGVGGDNYDAKLSFGIEWKIQDLWVGLFWKKEHDAWIAWVCLIPCVPIRIHYQRAYGGSFL